MALACAQFSEERVRRPNFAHKRWPEENAIAVAKHRSRLDLFGSSCSSFKAMTMSNSVCCLNLAGGLEIEDGFASESACTIGRRSM